MNKIKELPFEYRDNLSLSNSTTFGIEIEFDNVSSFAFLNELKNHPHINFDTDFDCSLGMRFKLNNRSWHEQDDLTVSSNQDNITEVVSPIFIDNKDSWNDIKNMCEYIKHLNGKITELCGGHIHFGAHEINKDLDKYLTLIKFWIIYEPLIYQFYYGFSKPRCMISEYAKSLNCKEIINLIQEPNDNIFEFVRKYNETLKVYYGIADRRFSLNLLRNNGSTNTTYKNTLEVRCPNGTLDYTVWQNNINFFAKLLETIINNKIDKDYINNKFDKLINGFEIYISEFELVDLVFVKELDKLYFLKQFYKYQSLPKSKILTKTH